MVVSNKILGKSLAVEDFNGSNLKGKGIHRLVEYNEILQNLHPQQVKILKVILQRKGVTKSEIADLLGIDRKTATEPLAALRRKKVITPKRDVEPCALLLEYIVRETLFKEGKFSESGRMLHTDLMRNFNKFSSRWTYFQIKKLCRSGYVDAEWQYTKDGEPYDPYYTVTPEGLSYIEVISPINPDFVPQWFLTEKTAEIINNEGESIIGSNFYTVFKKTIDHLSHSQEQALTLLLLHRNTGLTKEKITDSINNGVRGSVESILQNLYHLRKKGIAFSQRGHSQKWVILETVVKETRTGTYITRKEIQQKTGFRIWWIKQNLEELIECKFVKRDKRYFSDYFTCTQEGINHIKDISPIIHQRGTIWYPTAETLHVLLYGGKSCFWDEYLAEPL